MNTNKKGFTLVEMLIVVAIIGILSGIILLGLGPARRQAKNAKVMANAKSIAAKVETCANGQGGDYTGCCASQTIGGIVYTSTLCNTSGYCFSAPTDANADFANNCTSCSGCGCSASLYCMGSQ